MTASLSLIGEPSLIVLRPLDVARLFPDLGTFETPGVWVYRYVDEGNGWRLSIATCAEPGSGKLSLGGFRIAPAQLAAAITPRTRWLVLNSPGNPTGAVYRAEELRALGEVLRAHPREIGRAHV